MQRGPPRCPRDRAGGVCQSGTMRWRNRAEPDTVGLREGPEGEGNGGEQAQGAVEGSGANSIRVVRGKRQRVFQEGAGENGGCRPCRQADGDAEKVPLPRFPSDRWQRRHAPVRRGISASRWFRCGDRQGGHRVGDAGTADDERGQAHKREEVGEPVNKIFSPLGGRCGSAIASRHREIVLLPFRRDRGPPGGLGRFPASRGSDRR